jgi:ubiquitin-protein ligase
MSFPRAVVVKRLSNELNECRGYLGSGFTFDPDLVRFPMEIEMTMHNVVGYETADKLVTEHRFAITFTEDYGQRKPEVRWLSHIFHPNIMDPDDGGLVCMKMLNDWTYGTHLISFLNSVEMLVANPNPLSAFGTKSCTEAAVFFSGHGKSQYTASIRFGDR